MRKRSEGSEKKLNLKYKSKHGAELELSIGIGLAAFIASILNFFQAKF